jgi:hypothetical protein
MIASRADHSIGLGTLAASLVLLSSVAGAEEFSPPKLESRTIDACIDSPRFPSSQGTQCTQEAQRIIADTFCRQKGADDAVRWASTDTGQFQKSVKFTENGGQARWRRDDTGGAIFTSITCSGQSSQQTASQQVPAVRVGQIHEECILVWDDSIQVHRVETRIELFHQSVSTEMKKLRHCIRLRVTGPIDIGGLAETYVKRCVDYGINHQATRYILQALVSIGADVLATKGGATAATVADYVKSVADGTISCLTDQDRAVAFFQEELKAKFDAAVDHESHWIYWWL